MSNHKEIPNAYLLHIVLLFLLIYLIYVYL